MNLRARDGVRIRILRLKSVEAEEPLGAGVSSLTSNTDWNVTRGCESCYRDDIAIALTFSATLAQQCCTRGGLLAAP